MAKVTKFTGSQLLEITPKSNNTVWEYAGESTSYTFRVSPSAIGTVDYENYYRSFAVKQKNDVVITTLFTTGAGKLKKVTTTIKNYFADSTKIGYSLGYKSYFNQSETSEYYINPSTSEGSNGLYGSEGTSQFLLASTEKDADMVIFSGANSAFVYDTQGNDSYTSTRNGDDYVYELAGSDYYKSRGGGTLWVYDWAGSDYYDGTDSSKLRVYDYAGKDYYRVGSNACFSLKDYAGNDDYMIIDNKGDIAPGLGRTVLDFKGNDAYDIRKSKSVAIADNDGNDKYDINDSEVVITDAGKGNDTFNIDYCLLNNYGTDDNKSFYIENEKGNDTYNILGLVFNSWEDDSVAIRDNAGNDQYNFKGTVENDVVASKVSVLDIEGNDKYNLQTSTSLGNIYEISINDQSGKDTYTINGSSSSLIYYVNIDDYDTKSNDKYVFDTVSDFNIVDYGGNDTYKITNNTLSGDENAIVDNGGSDKYTINPSSGLLYIQDEQNENDSYSIDLSNTSSSIVAISDKGGTKDSLTLSNIKKDSIVLMADICSDGNIEKSLIAYNIDTKSFVYIDKFYNTSANGKSITGFGEGRIETIKAKNGAIKDAQTTELYDDFNALRGEISSWISNYTGQDSVAGVLTDGSDAQREILVAYFTHQPIPFE